MGIGLFVTLVTAYGWFLNIAYILKKGKVYNPNILIQVAGVFIPVLGAIMGYYTLFRNRSVKN